jgi:hypothetical protein
MTALLIDTFRRYLPTFAVSVTRTATGEESGGLVLRFATEVAKLHEYVQPLYPSILPFPTIILTRGYAAMTSGGFTRVISTPGAGWHGGKSYRGATPIVGICGFQWMPRKALRPVREPWATIILPAGTVVAQVQTHENSNTDTANAAISGIELLASIRGESVFVLEGQSDYTRGFEFTPPAPSEETEWVNLLREIPAEHRPEIFLREEEPRIVA